MGEIEQFFEKGVNLVVNFGTVFLSISILVQKCQFCAKKIEILGEMLTLSFCKICLFFLVKCDILCEGLYTLTKCQILIKNFNFLGYVNLYMY